MDKPMMDKLKALLDLRFWEQDDAGLCLKDRDFSWVTIRDAIRSVLTEHDALKADNESLRRPLRERITAAQDLQDEVERLIGDLARCQVQMAGVSTAAMGWNEKPATKGDYGWSVAYQDVLELRQKYEQALAEVEELRVQLGNRDSELLIIANGYKKAEAALAEARPLLEAAGKLTEPGMLSLHRVLSFCNIHDGCSYCKEMDKRLTALIAALAYRAKQEAKK